MKRTRSYLIIGSVILLASCGNVEITPMQSDACLSLVVRRMPLSGREAVCVLPEGTAPTKLLPEGLLGSGPTSALRDRLSALGHPVGARLAENGTKWFKFDVTVGQLEAGCTPQDTSEESCVWRIVATGLPKQLSLDSRLERLVATVAADAGEDFTIHLISSPRPNGSKEQVSIRLQAKSVAEVEWLDPMETKGMQPGWASQ